jgi:hypothetical protein
MTRDELFKQIYKDKETLKQELYIKVKRTKQKQGEGGGQNKRKKWGEGLMDSSDVDSKGVPDIQGKFKVS